jgi:hypothetical protein
LDKKSSNENLDNTSKILNQVSFFSNSHLDAEEINEIDDEDENLNGESQKKKKIFDSSNGEEGEEEEEDDDHKQDVNFISEIYQKFMFKNAEKIVPKENVNHAVDLIQSDDTFEEKAVDVEDDQQVADEKDDDDDDDDDDKEEESHGIYSQWSKQFNSKNDMGKKENNKFSKSFEVKNINHLSK